MKQTVLCYKTVNPTIYNAGTKYESSCDTFLACYWYNDKEKAMTECERLNTEKPAKLWNGLPIDWTKIKYFYVTEQEPFEG